jgi:hypothetical protein
MGSVERRQENRRAHNTALWSAPALEIPFLCECGREGCGEIVPLSAGAYRLIVEAGGRPVSESCLRRDGGGRGPGPPGLA